MCFKPLTTVAGSVIAQPPGIRLSALRVATHSQQVASLGGGEVLPLCRGAVDVFYSSNRQGVNHQGSVLAPYGSQITANKWPDWRCLIPSADIQSVYSTSQSNRADGIFVIAAWLAKNYFLYCRNESANVAT